MPVARVFFLLLLLSGAAFIAAEEGKQAIYCGTKNCYDVLGLTEKAKPSDIKRAYRTLSMEWHPDKNTNPGAKDRFAEIAHAYGILVDEEQRRDYDYALKHPERVSYNQYRYYYGQYYRKHVKVNPFLVIFLFLLSYSAIQYFSMKYSYERALRAIKTSHKYKMALKALKQEKLDEMERERGASSKGKNGKRSKKDLDAVEVDESIILERVQIHGGYAKPVLSELVIFSAFSWPYHLVKGIIWQYNWYMKYNVRKEEYSEEDKGFLTRSVVGMSLGHWNGLEPKRRAEWLSKELWIEENARKWRESQKFVWD